jgi:eukaryotic-like serine/threonine-protein kinase
MLGSRLGHYEVRGRLGAGGMGEVFRVHDTRLGRDVALKVLCPEVTADAERRDRFLREARLLAALDHPGIVTVHSIEEEGGVRFLTMQLVEGETLDELIPQDGMPFDRYFEIAVPLAEAVAAAHERGIVHRDLKPANVMRSHKGRIKVLDFGLAKLYEPPRTSIDGRAPTDLRTQEGVVLGTLPYMAPEQIEGGELDARTDVFALGVVLYEMATGRRPFSGPTPAALRSSILETRPPDPGALRSGLPRPLGRLLRSCLERDPRRRPASAVSVRDDLREASSGLERVASSSGGGGAAARATPSSIAVLPFASLSADKDDEYFADGVAEEIINALGRLPDLRVAARTSTFAFKGKPEDLREIGEKLGVGSVLEGSVRRAGKRLRIAAQLVDVASGYQLWSERYDRELDDVFEIQDQIARSIAARFETSLESGASKQVEQGQRDVAAFEAYARARGLLAQRTEPALRRAIDHFRDATDRDPTYALAWSGMATATVMFIDYYGGAEPDAQIAGAQEAVNRALALAPELPEAHATLGLLHYRRRDGPGAMRELERSVELRPSYADGHSLLGWVGMLVGRLDTAMTATRRAIELDPLSPESYSHLPLLLIGEGRIEDAVRAAETAVALQPDFTTSILYRAAVLFHAGDLDGCRALASGLSAPWAGSAPEVLLAVTAAAQGDQSAARSVADRLAAAGEPDLAGLALAVLGDVDAAFAAFARVETWGYWPILVLRLLFPRELAALRADARYPAILAAIDRQWGMLPRAGTDGRSGPP